MQRLVHAVELEEPQTLSKGNANMRGRSKPFCQIRGRTIFCQLLLGDRIRCADSLDVRGYRDDRDFVDKRQ